MWCSTPAEPNISNMEVKLFVNFSNILCMLILFLVHVKQTPRQHYSEEWHSHSLTQARVSVSQAWACITSTLPHLLLTSRQRPRVGPWGASWCLTTTDLPPLAMEFLRPRLLTTTTVPPSTATQLRYICTEVSSTQHYNISWTSEIPYSRLRGWHLSAGQAGRGRHHYLHHLRGGCGALHDYQLLYFDFCSK